MAVDNDIYIFAYNFADVGMKPVCKGWNIFVHLYNKKFAIEFLLYTKLCFLCVPLHFTKRSTKVEGVKNIQKISMWFIDNHVESLGNIVFGSTSYEIYVNLYA